MVDDETPTTTPSEKNGADVEKWILRILLAGVVGAVVVAVLGSVDDIKRYIEIREM